MPNLINKTNNKALCTILGKGYHNLVKISKTADVYKGLKGDLEVSIKISSKRNIDWNGIVLTTFKLIKFGIAIAKPVEVFDFEDKEIIVCAYIKGNIPNDNHKICEFVIEIFRKITRIPIPQGKLRMNIVKEQELYYKSKFVSHLDTIVSFDKDFKAVAKKLLPYNDLYILNKNDLSYQHGDLHIKNIIDSLNNKYYLIDINSIKISSKYLDLATFIAKTLDNTALTKNVYLEFKNNLSGKEFGKFNLQLIFAFIKEYKNIIQLSNKEKELPIFKKTALTLEDKIKDVTRKLDTSKSLRINIF